MSELNPSQEPLPYHHNNYHEKLSLYYDTTRTLLDTYSHTEPGSTEIPLDVARWRDEEIATDYELARRQHSPHDHSVTSTQINLTITEYYPNGEQAVTLYYAVPANSGIVTQTLQMTKAQQARYDERVKHATELPNGMKILPYDEFGLSPEHRLELLLEILAKAFEILERE